MGGTEGNSQIVLQVVRDHPAIEGISPTFLAAFGGQTFEILLHKSPHFCFGGGVNFVGLKRFVAIIIAACIIGLRISLDKFGDERVRAGRKKLK